MKSRNEIRDIALSTIKSEKSAVENLMDFIEDDFIESVETIYNSGGRVVITGIGKSAIIASKIVATLNSTGTPAIFMHAADAIHGDLGIIQNEDVIICISNSGNTPEIKVLIPLIRIRGNPLIAMVGNIDSYLARQADLIIRTTVNQEATPNNYVPTSSTTTQLVMGDALAVCLLECRGFTVSDFAKYHPGGALGKKMYLRVADLYAQNEAPAVQTDTLVREVIIEISSKRLGATAVLDGSDLAGVITDGDLRRMLENNETIDNIIASEIMSSNPQTISPKTLVIDALSLMRKNNITQLLVVEDGKYIGIIHLHDVLKEGIL